MKSGDVFLATLSPTEPKHHFWVIVLATSQNYAVCGNITSWCVDKTTPIYEAEYKLLQQPVSYFNYPQIRLEEISKIENNIKLGIARKCPALSTSLLKQIQEGVVLSKYVPNNIKDLVKKYLKL